LSHWGFGRILAERGGAFLLLWLLLGARTIARASFSAWELLPLRLLWLSLVNSSSVGCSSANWSRSACNRCGPDAVAFVTVTATDDKNRLLLWLRREVMLLTAKAPMALPAEEVNRNMIRFSFLCQFRISQSQPKSLSNELECVWDCLLCDVYDISLP
jgi:hypothetical protein